MKFSISLITLRILAMAALCGLLGCGGGGGGGDSVGGNNSAVGSGKVDPTYGDGGKAGVTVPDFPGRMAVSPDGSVYITGGPVKKLDPNGKPAPFAFGDVPHDPLIAIPRFVDNDGAVYLWYGVIAKVAPDGNLVTSFGTNGLAGPPIANSFGWDTEFTRDVNGNFYMAGAQFDPNDIGHFRWTVAKLDREGRPVNSFGSGGQRTFVFRDVHVGPRISLAADSVGNVYIASLAPDQRTMLVVKLDSAGTLASDFATSGMWLAQGCDTAVGATAIALDTSGNVLVAGDCPQTGDAGRPKVFKLDAHGNVISSFRDAGLRSGLFGTTPLGPTGREPSGTVRSLLMSPSGDIYAAGSRSLPPAPCRDFVVAKLNASGDPVRTFGDNGVAVFDVADDEFSDVQMDGAGRLYAGGVSHAGCDPTVGTAMTFFVYRLGA